MPVRRLVGVPPRRTGPTGAASPVGPDCTRTPRCFGARLLLRGFQGGDLLRQSLGTVSGVVVVRVDRRCRAHEQPCGTHPPLGSAVAQEFLWLPQRGGVSVRGADVDRGTNPAVAETSGARLPVSRDRSPSIRPSRSAITGPGRGLNGYVFYFQSLTARSDIYPHPEGGRGPGTACGRGFWGRIWIEPRPGRSVAG